MKDKLTIFGPVVLAVMILAAGCAADKNYRDASGVLKTETRSTVGVHK